jgi:glyceraldehyde 3-phosphate dehydrogenase
MFPNFLPLIKFPNLQNKIRNLQLYQLKYDSVHGQFNHHVEKTTGGILVDGKKVQVFDKKDPKDIPWGSVGATFVCDATGAFLEQEKAQSHLISGNILTWD